MATLVKTFNYFISSFKDATKDQKLQLLVNHASLTICQHVTEGTSISFGAIEVLDSIYINPE